MARRPVFRQALKGMQKRRMGLVIKLLVVTGLGAVELWAAAPAGLAMRIHPVAVFTAAAAGGIASGIAVILLGERVREWIRRRRAGDDGGSRTGIVYRIWQRYGVIGWGLLAPLLTGSPLGAALGLALGAPARRLSFWISVGSVLWSAVFTLIAVLGMRALKL